MSVLLYRTRADIIDEMVTQLQDAIPDVYVGEDGVLYIMFAIESGQFENAFMANQYVLQDMFIQSASLTALRLHGDQYNLSMKEGTYSYGVLRLEGAGGTYIGVDTQVAYDSGTGLEPTYFTVNVDGTIPNPGDPDVPVAANGAAGGLTGTYEYLLTFLTTEGETLPSDPSNAVTPSAQQVNLTNLTIGGPGTTARRIYRDKGGAGTYRLVAQISNAGTTYTDNISDATVAAGSLVPVADTAHRISLDGQSVETGVGTNVAANSITTLVDVPAEVTGVTNPAAFTGGSDPEDIEEFRSRLLAYLRNAQTGSPSDLKTWAEGIAGVETATVFPNDNLGVATPGHVTVRITGEAGAVPTQAVLDAVYADLYDRDLANLVIHVASFNPVTTNVTVDVTVGSGFVIGDVTPSVQKAVTDYINSLNVGETFYLSGVIAVVKPLTGISDVVVTSPATNLTTATTDKRIAGTISVV